MDSTLSYKRFETKQHDDVIEIRLLDRQLSDLMLQSELSDEFINFATNEKPKKVVVNFANVVYCNTGTIGALIQLRKNVIATNGLMKLCHISQPIRDAFQALNLDGTLFEIHDTIDEANHSFG